MTLSRFVSPTARTFRRAGAGVIVTMVFAACSGGASPTAVPVGATAGALATIIPTDAVTAAPTIVVASPSAVPTVPPVTAPPITAPPPTVTPTTLAPAIGVALQIGDEQLMTVLQAEVWPGVEGTRPAKGKAFFTVSIRIDAIKLTSFESADFKLRDAEGHSYSWRTGRASHLYGLSNMSAGNYYTGWITYEVPKAVVGELTLIYKPSFLDGTTYKVQLY